MKQENKNITDLLPSALVALLAERRLELVAFPLGEIVATIRLIEGTNSNTELRKDFEDEESFETFLYRLSFRLEGQLQGFLSNVCCYLNLPQMHILVNNPDSAVIGKGLDYLFRCPILMLESINDESLETPYLSMIFSSLAAHILKLTGKERNEQSVSTLADEMVNRFLTALTNIEKRERPSWMRDIKEDDDEQFELRLRSSSQETSLFH